MARPFRGYNRIINNYQKYDYGPCLNSYSTLKNEIDQRIDHFYNVKHTNIYNEWFQLYKYINEKNASIKHCIVKGYIKSDFSEDEKVKNFSSICNKSRICHINVESNINTNPALKKTGSAESCRGRTNCKTEKAKTKEAAGKTKLRSQLEAQPSKETHLQRPKAQKTGREYAGGEESNKQIEVLLALSDVRTLPNSIKSKGDEPESVTDKQSSTSVQGSTSTQAFPDTENTPSRELNHQAKDSPSQSNSAGEFHAGGTLRVSNSGKSHLENNLSDNQTLDANQRNMQTHEGGDVENQDNNHQIVVTELPNRVSKLGRDSASEKLGDKGSVDKDNSIHGNNDVAHDLEDAIPLDNQKESVVSAPNEGVSSDDARLDRETYDGGVHGAANCREIEHSQEPGSEHLCNGPLCRAEKVNEMDTNDGNILGTLSEFFNGIQDNPQIIKTSAPIGIALLLGLLFKFTPLWRVLTKKNTKKGAGINEELNSVLQEPSIMDDERSIPFSYGGFEYSTFDQNTY